jgi:Raf kinase inhibitor-like YbhB/YbcL family protein
MKRIAVHAALVFALAASGGWAYAQGEASAQAGPPVLAKDVLRAPTGVRLLVTSSAFNSGSPLDDKYTQNGDNMSPPLTWSKGPAGTQSYAVFAEDAGVNRHDPITHWVLYDIPSTTTTLRENIPTDAKLDSGMMQGLNVRKAAGFVGPKPPAGQTHPYHFEVFALNRSINVDPAKADRAAVIDAMKGHVLAVGDIVANYTGK